VWPLTKRSLANGRPDTVDELIADLVLSMETVRAAPHLLRSCITHSELPRSWSERCIISAEINNVLRPAVVHCH
jgi:hypothetical protein